MRDIRLIVNEAIEPLRSQKIIRSSLEADVDLSLQARDYEWFDASLFTEVAIVARVIAHGDHAHPGDVPAAAGIAQVAPPTDRKCGRCRRHLPAVAEACRLWNPGEKSGRAPCRARVFHSVLRWLLSDHCKNQKTIS